MSLRRLWGIAVYKIDILKLASWAFLVGIDLRLSNTSSEFFNIQKALTPVFLYILRQYSLKCLRISLSAEFRNLERGLGSTFVRGRYESVAVRVLM